MADLIDRIEEVRIRNNTYWMALLRLALDVAPDEAKIILGKIEQADTEITSLLRDLADS